MVYSSFCSTPEFVVFYNGTTEKPDSHVLRLSTAFEESSDKSLGSLELEVPVYNINKGMNKELFKKSNKLKQYSDFVAKLRELSKLHKEFAQAVKETVNHCIANDILADFLKEHGGKIVSILTMEYNEELAKRVYAEEYAEAQINERNIELAIKMLLKSEPIEKIIEYTELPLDVIKSLQLSHKDVLASEISKG